MQYKDPEHKSSVELSVNKVEVPLQPAENSRFKSEGFARITLDALATQIAILDEAGTIIATNRAWRDFAQTNHPEPWKLCEGANVLDVCDMVQGGGAEKAAQFAAAVRSIIRGEQNRFSLEYSSYTADEKRWFRLDLTGFSAEGAACVLLARENISGRRCIEERVRISEELYRSVVEDQTEVISRLQKDGTFIFVNEVYCRFFGKQPEQLIGQKWQPVAVPEDLPHIQAQLATLSPASPVVTIENRVYAGSGEVRWMQFVNRAVFDGEGCLSEIQSVGRDITERKHMEEQLRWRQAELQAIYDHASFMLCLLDENGRVVFANRAFAAYSGRAPAQCSSEFAGDALGCIKALDDPRGCGFGPECAECALRRSILDTMETGKSHRNIEHITTVVRQGENLTVVWLVNTARIAAEHGKLVLVTMEDITEYRRAEEKMRASEMRLRAIYENSILGILFTSPDGRVFNANPAASKILGRSEEEICRLGRHGLVDPQTPNLAGILKERVRTGRVEARLTYIRGDGTRLPVETASMVFDTAQGPRTCTMLWDVSEKEATEAKVQQFSQRLLAIREEEKKNLSAALHHDVGSMSVGVCARLEAAEEDLHSGQPKKALATLKECQKVFSESVKRLKSLAMELRPPDLDILGLPVALRQHFTRVSRDTPLRIHFTDATHGQTMESTIETILFRVAQECLNNVVKHAGAGVVRVRLSIGKRGTYLSFVDNGRGFDAQNASRQSTEGMGLYAVGEMVSSEGGRLTIKSSPGRGTKIRIRIPHKGSRL